MPMQQATRFLNLKTPLGENVLLLTSFTGREEMSRLFSYQLDMISDKNDIKAADIVGKNVTFSVLLADESQRHFNGFVSRFVAGDEDSEGRRNYRAEVVPWLWFLTQTADCRIFQEKSLPQIIKQIFDDLGFTDYEIKEIKGQHPKWEYCVQYRETDFNFVSRLMEQEGIFYFFKHESGKHTLVLSDQKGAYQDCQEKEVDFPTNTGTRAITDHLTSWEHRYQFRPGKWAQTDYNFETPSTSLMTNTNTLVQLPGVSKFEIYDYPGEYEAKADGDGDTKVRMEEEEVAHDVVWGTSLCKTFTPGHKFKTRKHRSSSEEGKRYVITSIQHHAQETRTYETGEVVGMDYSNSFTCIPDSVTFRPARTTPKPIVSGVQTAVVVGPGGEEIFVDKYGRVKVQFFWDREGKKDEKSSCFIRVSQNWAGKNWGIHFHPRIGQEVIVDFLEGDPDRPIITGRVYNAEQMPPYTLPDHKTRSGIKTRSTKDGTPDNFNEIRFEDKKGEEQLFIHAEKNQDIEVENDETHWVGRDRKKTIDRDEVTSVKRDRTETVDRDERISIGSNRTETVGKNERISIGENRTEEVGKEEAISIGASRSTNIGKNEIITVAEARNEQVGKNEDVQIGGDRNHTVAKNDGLSVGKKLVVTAGDEISLVTGSASIVMKKNGDIQISGKNITITGSGKINVKASGDMTLKGSKIKEN